MWIRSSQVQAAGILDLGPIYEGGEKYLFGADRFDGTTEIRRKIPDRELLDSMSAEEGGGFYCELRTFLRRYQSAASATLINTHAPAARQSTGVGFDPSSRAPFIGLAVV